MIVKYMRENRVLKAPDGNVALNEFTNGETWKKYIRRMQQDGAWGDHLVLIAAASLFRVTITVISTASDQPLTIGVCQDTIGNIFIGHICELHYVSLCDIDETDQGRNQLEGQCAATLKDHSVPYVISVVNWIWNLITSVEMKMTIIREVMSHISFL